MFQFILKHFYDNYYVKHAIICKGTVYIFYRCENFKIGILTVEMHKETYPHELYIHISTRTIKPNYHNYYCGSGHVKGYPFSDQNHHITAWFYTFCEYIHMYNLCREIIDKLE